MGSVFSYTRQADESTEVQSYPSTPNKNDSIYENNVDSPDVRVADSEQNFWNIMDPRSPSLYISRTPLKVLFYYTQQALSNSIKSAVSTPVKEEETPRKRTCASTLDASPQMSPITKLKFTDSPAPVVFNLDEDSESPVIVQELHSKAQKPLRPTASRGTPIRLSNTSTPNKKSFPIFCENVEAKLSPAKTTPKSGKHSQLTSTRRSVLMDISNNTAC
jgi:hypothetical protein